MSLQLNLEKATQSLVLNLEKKGIAKPPALEVGFGMDVSGSFDDEHRQGLTDTLLTRLVPWGLTFDPDKKLDVFSFSDGAASVQDVGPIDASNYYGFVQKKIIGITGYNGGTAYSHLIERTLKHFGWSGDVVKKAGFFGSLMGKKDTVVAGAKKKSLVIIATDGDNNESGDKDRTKRVLAESEARKDEVYFLFLGVSNQQTNFDFIKKLGDRFSNVGFVPVTNLAKFGTMTDDEVNELLIGDELLAWLKA